MDRPMFLSPVPQTRERDVLVFYSGSADVAPGKGVHERVTRPTDYAELTAIKDWRKKLSNFDSEVPFVWEGAPELEITFPPGTQWRSIEHAFQAAKIGLKDKEKAMRFTLNSGTALGRGDGSDAQKQRKMVLLDHDDLEYWASINELVMASVARAKYLQHPDSVASRVLKATRNARLLHLMRQRGKPSQFIPFEHLAQIRRELP